MMDNVPPRLLLLVVTQLRIVVGRRRGKAARCGRRGCSQGSGQQQVVTGAALVTTFGSFFGRRRGPPLQARDDFGSSTLDRQF